MAIPFLSIGGEASRDLEVGSDISLDVDFENLGVIRIRPGEWFSEHLVNMFKNGPFVDGSLLNGTGPTWGPNSKLGWHPGQVVIADHPTFTVTLPLVSRYKKLKAAFLRGAPINIGPFHFQVSDSSVAKMCWDDEKQSFTLKDSSDSPMILAVINEPE
jgi:hypothetical protein